MELLRYIICIISRNHKIIVDHGDGYLLNKKILIEEMSIAQNSAVKVKRVNKRHLCT